MKFFWCIAAFLVALASQPSVSQASDLAALAEVLPKCALGCIVELIPQSPCSLTNTTCFCTNEKLTADITVCVSAACTVREALTTKNITSQACGAPVRDSTKAVSVTGVTGGILCFIVFIMRMISRIPGMGGGKFGWDDAVMCFCMLLVIPLTCLSVVLAEVGLGRDMWTLPFDNITSILYIYYFDEDLYLASLALIKISLLLFYVRIFPDKRFHKICYCVMGLCAGYGIAFVLVSVFQCRPVRMAWLQWDGTFHGKCNHINAQGWTSAVLNIVLDIVTLSLPLPHLYRLALSWRKKLQIMCMFGVGFFVTCASILRLVSLIQFGKSTNISMDYVSVGYWSTIEIHFGVICASMPACRALWQRIFPRILGSTQAEQSTGNSKISRRVSAVISKGSVPSENRDVGDRSDFIPLVDVESQKSRDDSLHH